MLEKNNVKCEFDILKAIKDMTQEQQNELVDWIIKKINEKEVTITPLVLRQNVLKAIDDIHVSDTLL